ncbi:hypothetical protein V9T40_013265 [Parthenolecanium corni]|uniref:Rabphilin n=1 Tax=Parthenolecanium corni TaxID=536013 RepID=A0AAN9Y709_9HEMI
MEDEVKNNRTRSKGLYPIIIPDICNQSPVAYSRSKSLSDERTHHPPSNWVCPNDRQLMLRAKLRIGWCVKAELYEKYGCKPKPLSDSEQEAISSVIKRAEALEKQEQERIGRLVERLDNMKRHTLGSGTKQCILCGDKFGFLGSSAMICYDCKKSVCTKCGIETTSPKQKELIWLCKICAETREMWKKSGAWFYKSMPKYVIPPKTDKYPNNYRLSERDPLWNKSQAHDRNDDDSSSEDDWKMTVSTPSRYKSNIISPTSPGSVKSISANSNNALSSSPKSVKTGISETGSNLGKSKTHCDRTSQPDELFETGSNRTLSSESFGIVPQIYVNYETNGLSHYEFNDTDKVSVSSGPTTVSKINEDAADDEVSPVDLNPKTGHCMGTITLSIQYDPDANSLHIFLHSSKGLKGTDVNGLSDPFCKLNLLPVGAKSYRLRTRTVPKTTDPEFNETLTFYGITDNDILTQSLHILILDDDKYGHDFLGEAKFPLNKLKPRITRDLCLTLEKHIPGDLEDEVWGEGCGSNGQIVLSLSYSTRKRALIVGIIKCINLLPMDSNGFSDPFVKLWLKSSTGGSSPKYKTSIQWKNLNPVYNEEFAINTKLTDLSQKSLIITVWDKDPGRSNDYLGCLELGVFSKGDRLRQWLDMMKYPDRRHEGTHNLSEDPIKN